MKFKSPIKNGKAVKPTAKSPAVTSPKKSEASSSKNKKQTKQKSPTKKSGYLIFSIKKRKEIIGQEPYKSMKQPEVFKAIGQMWKDLSTEEKNAFNEEAKKENEKIVEAKEEEKEEEKNEDDVEMKDTKEKRSPSAQ